MSCPCRDCERHRTQQAHAGKPPVIEKIHAPHKVDVERYRAHMEEWAAAWSQRAKLNEGFAVKGRDLEKLLDVYEAALEVVEARNAFELDDSKHETRLTRAEHNLREKIQ